jgi:general secretion pathway protein H
MSATGDRRGDAGSTLIEALVVVAVTALITTLIYPDFRQAVARAAFEQAAAGVRADLRIARAQAIRSGERVQIEVAADGRTYGWTPGPRRGLVGDMTLAPAGDAVLFFPDGSAANGEMALGDARRRIRFEVDDGTGLLRASR